MQLLLLLTSHLSSEARVLKGSRDPGRAPNMLYPDRGIPPNTTGAADPCKSDEELYYNFEQGLSSHNGKGAPSESGESFFILYSRGSGKRSLRGLANSYCAAGEAGSLGGVMVG